MYMSYGKKEVFEMKVKFLLRFAIAIILVIGLSRAPKVDAYYGMGGMMGGMYGMGGMMGGMYGMGMMGGMYGMGMMGGMYGMGGPFSIYNMYYPVDTGTGLTYQLPFMMALPYIGMSSLYSQLFPNLFNPSSKLGTTPVSTAAPLPATTATAL
jgi:hypothetical protein